MEAVAVYSDADASAAHVRAADIAIRLGPAPAGESYLRREAILDAARATGADAIHPGYGFLAERADFATAVVEAGLAWVGPDAAAIARLGDKLAARRVAATVGVRVVPGTLEAVSVERADQVVAVLAEADRVGFPLLVKAAAGGGGRGMRRVERRADLPAALAAGSHEARAAFGDGTVYLERELRPARHIEVQLLGDHAGTVVAVGERDCSTQRRHQKLIEEAPAPGLTRDERHELHGAAVRLGAAAGLTNAATAEFLFDAERRFSFLEVNTRLQVEHGVSELVSGIDIVVEQFRLAAGEPLSGAARSAALAAAEPDGHAIEVRLSAEDPARDFAPDPGWVTRWVPPGGPGVRVDTAIESGVRIPTEYDPLIAKILVHGPDRDTAIVRLRRALNETEIGGIQTTLPFLRAAVRHPRFVGADLSTDWVAEAWDGPADRSGIERAALLAAALTASDGLESPAAFAGDMPGGSPGPGASPSEWRAIGRSDAIDRWPR